MTTLSTTNKTALITGASSGIGMALAHQFAQDGYQLVLAARGVAKMQALADELQRKFKVSVTVIGADATTTDGYSTTLFVLGVERGLALINQQPGVDALIIDANHKLHLSRGLTP